MLQRLSAEQKKHPEPLRLPKANQALKELQERAKAVSRIFTTPVTELMLKGGPCSCC